MRRFVRRALFRVAVAAVVSVAPATVLVAEPGRYVEVNEFLEESLGSVPDSRETLYLDAGLRERIEAAIGHRLGLVRLRYWRHADTTAWVLDEIGKTEPITIGIAISDGRVAKLRVLEFRESRGWEIRYPFFTDQYTGAEIDGSDRIDRKIDGITGATLSVAAVNRVVRMALLLDERVRNGDEPHSS